MVIRGAFYFILDSKGLKGEFFNENDVHVREEVAIPIEDVQGFVGIFKSRWNDGNDRVAKLTISMENTSFYSLDWHSESGGPNYTGRAILRNDVLIGYYTSTS